MAKIATRRSEMTVGAREALNALDASLMQMFEVDCSAIPEHLRGKKDTISFVSLMKKITPKKKAAVDPRGVSVKFNTAREVVESTPERMDTLNAYRDGVAVEAVEVKHIDDRQLYENQLKFACQLAEWGWFSEEDFEVED